MAREDDESGPGEGRRVGVLVLSGLHASEENAWAWSDRPDELRRALDKPQADGWRADLVVLAGNLTRQGQHRDFAFLRRQYDQLREVLARGGAAPVLFAVPGPSDALASPELGSGAEIVATQWAERDDIQRDFQHDPRCLWRQVIDASFDPFTTWWRVVAKEQPAGFAWEGTLVPGEHSATVTVNGVRVRLVGYNSALQCVGGMRPRGELVLDEWRVAGLRRESSPSDVELLVFHHDRRSFDGATQRRIAARLNDPDHPAALALCARPSGEVEAEGDGGAPWVEVPSVAGPSERAWSRDEFARGLVALTLTVGERKARAKVVERTWDHGGPVAMSVSRSRSTDQPTPGVRDDGFDVRRRGTGFAPVEESAGSWLDEVAGQALRRYQGRRGAEALARAALPRRADLADFVHDHFPEVYSRYSDHIPYDAGVRLLLDEVQPDAVVKTLSDALPSVVRKVMDEAGERASSSPSGERFKLK